MRTGQATQTKTHTLDREGLAMEIVVVLAVMLLIGLAVVFGLSADTRQPGRRWYPASPDLSDKFRVN